MLKFCYKCKLQLDISLFYVNKSKKDEHCDECKSCKLLQAKKYQEKNKLKVIQKSLHKKCSFCNLLLESLHFYEDKTTPDHLNRYCKPCCNKKNSELYFKNKQKNILIKQLKKENKLIQAKLARRLRKRIQKIIPRNKISKSVIQLLGCSLETFKTYLESKFQPDMSWDNYGQFGWHIDHIKPLSSFDLFKEEDTKEACHYTNLQPLWWKENLNKGKKIINGN